MASKKILQELAPWTDSTAPVNSQDIGKVSQEASDSLGGLLRLVTACGAIRSAHDKLHLSGKHQVDPHLEQQHRLQNLLAATAEQRKQLQCQQQDFPAIDKRLSESRLPQLADL